ncbi:MAG: hypothetical protein F6K47_25180 [Symploca sp. SIO2E6]|nr:hypothetical protein [Symploca sp. SIO2E6]
MGIENGISNIKERINSYNSLLSPSASEPRSLLLPASEPRSLLPPLLPRSLGASYLRFPSLEGLGVGSATEV